MAAILPVSILLVLITVGVHYEMLAFGSRRLGKLPTTPRVRVLFAVLLLRTSNMQRHWYKQEEDC